MKRVILAGILAATAGLPAARAGDLPEGAILRLGPTGFRNQWGLSAIAFLPDSRTLVSTGSEVILWNARSGNKLRTLIKDLRHPAHRFVVSPDGRYVVAECGAYIRAWEVESGKRIFEISNIKQQAGNTMSFAGVDSIAYSPAGGSFAAFLGRNDVKVWRVPSGELLREFKTGLGGYRTVSFAGDGRRLLASPLETGAARGNGGTVQLWDVETGDELLTLPRIRRAAISPDGLLVACAGAGNAVRLVSVETGAAVRDLAGHAAPVQILAFSPDGKSVASGASNGEVIVWDAETSAVLRSITAGEAPVGRLRFSPDGTLLVTRDGERRSVLWQIESGRRLMDYRDGRAPRTMSNIAFSPDSRLLTVSDGNGYFVWDARTGKRLAGIDGHMDDVAWVAFSPDGKTILSAATDNSVATWDAAAGGRTALFRLEGRDLRFAAFSCDRKTAVFLRRHKSVLLHDSTTGRLANELSAPPERGDPRAHRPVGVAISPDGGTLASSGTGGEIVFWDMATGRRGSHVGGKGSGHAYGQPVFTPDGKRLLVEARREITRQVREQLMRKLQDARELMRPTLRIVDAASGDEHVQLDTAGEWWKGESCVFSPDGRIVAGARYNHSIHLWDAEDGRLMCRLIDPHRAVSSLDFSPDGRLLASGGGDGTVRLWDVGAEREIACFRAGADVRSVSFSPDGKRVASGLRDTTVLVWPVPAPARPPPPSEDDADVF
ncbi:MAG: WD40 repeat domain-containing protein [Planctomycetota bacterium]